MKHHKKAAFLEHCIPYAALEWKGRPADIDLIYLMVSKLGTTAGVMSYGFSLERQGMPGYSIYGI